MYAVTLQHSVLMTLQVTTNGVIFFGTGTAAFGLTEFSSLDPTTNPFVAPYWLENDASEQGMVVYEVLDGTSDRLDEVNNFISSSENVEFSGTWALVAQWLEVPQFGADDTVSSMEESDVYTCIRGVQHTA